MVELMLAMIQVATEVILQALVAVTQILPPLFPLMAVMDDEP